MLLQRDRDLPEKFKSTLQDALKQQKEDFSAIVQDALQQQSLKLEEAFNQQSDQLFNRLNNPATVLDSLKEHGDTLLEILAPQGKAPQQGQDGYLAQCRAPNGDQQEHELLLLRAE